MKKKIPCLGLGISLRPIHYEEILASKAPIDWFEIISENYMTDGGRPLYYLERILENYPVVMHGVSLAIGSATPLDWHYLKQLKALVRKTNSPWVSDHLSWGKLPHTHFHDLLPLPATAEIAAYVAERARVVQDFLEVPFALENLSSYLGYNEDEMSEWQFYNLVAELADISMMVDVNNIYVSSRNKNFDPVEYIEALPPHRIIQIHVAGHTDCGTHLIDTHDQKVADPVWQLYGKLIERTGPLSTLLEWDSHFLSFSETCQEILKAKTALETAPC